MLQGYTGDKYVFAIIYWNREPDELTLFNSFRVVLICVVIKIVPKCNQIEQGKNIMQTANNVFNWSCFISGVTGLFLFGAVAASWMVVEVLVVLVDVTAV